MQSVRRAGLPVELRVEGDAVGLAPGADLAAYRIVQEALTNALPPRRTGASHSCAVAYDSRRVLLEVADTGRGDGAYGNGAGQGADRPCASAPAYTAAASTPAGGRTRLFVTAELPLEPAG